MATITEIAKSRDITILADEGTIDVEEIAAKSNGQHFSRYLDIYPAGDHRWGSHATPQVTAVVRPEQSSVALVGSTGASWAYRSPPPYTPGLIRPFELGWPPYSVRLDAEATFDLSDAASAELWVSARIVGVLPGNATDSIISLAINGPGGEVYSLEQTETTGVDSFWTVSGDPLELVAGEYTMTAFAEKPQDRTNRYVYFHCRLSLVP